MNLVVTTHTALKTLLRLVAQERRSIRAEIRAYTWLPGAWARGRVTFWENKLRKLDAETEILKRACETHWRAGKDV